MQHEQITEKILKAFYRVYNTLGYGFLERVYQNAMLVELRKLGLSALASIPIDVYYEGEKVGFYVADILVEERVMLELKAGEGIVAEHEAQLTNYLRATEVEVGLLLGFCKTPIVKRKVFNNEFKIHGRILNNPFDPENPCSNL